MYGAGVRSRALELVVEGTSLSDVSRATGVARSTIRAWTQSPGLLITECPRCEGAWPSAAAEYAALLGFYLGDGCISTYKRCTSLRVSCDAKYPQIIADAPRLLSAAYPAGRR